jgi:hypothetical protein
LAVCYCFPYVHVEAFIWHNLSTDFSSLRQSLSDYEGHMEQDTAVLSV